MPGDVHGGFASLGSDPDEALRGIEQWAQGFADKAARYHAVQNETEQIRLSATSPDGRVKVTVRADGSVTDLQFTDKIRSMQPAELSAQILATMRKAQADIAGRVGAVMTAHLGDEDLQTRTMTLENLRERFPEQADEVSADTEAVAAEKWDLSDQDDAPDQSRPGPEQPGTEREQAAADPLPRNKARRRADDESGEDGFGEDFDPIRD